MSESDSRLDRFFGGAFFAALLVIAFIGGVLASVAGIFPGPQIERGYQGAHALYDQLTRYEDVYKSDLWYPARTTRKGVTVHEPDKAQQGLTLYSSGEGAIAWLIDMQGRIVHQWQRPFSSVWKPGMGDIEQPRPDPWVHFRNAHVYPNGDLVALYEGNGDTPYGYGVVKLDRDSQVIWFYPGRAHHQLNVGADGNIYVLTHAIVDDELEMLGHLARPRLEDWLVVLSPDGRELKKFRLLTALAQSKYRHMVYTVSGFALADPLHANAVDYIDRDEAAGFPFAEEGQVLLSFRETGAIAVLDPASGEIVWATRGPWIGQHDPDILASGHILLFDNYAHYDAPEGFTRVIEFDPRTMQIVWQYTGDAEHPLESRIRGDQQRLANGNTLIDESEGGRLVEVAPDGEIVWEYVNPVRGGPGDEMIPMMAWAQRIDPATLEPDWLKAKP